MTQGKKKGIKSWFQLFFFKLWGKAPLHKSTVCFTPRFSLNQRKEQIFLNTPAGAQRRQLVTKGKKTWFERQKKSTVAHRNSWYVKMVYIILIILKPKFSMFPLKPMWWCTLEKRVGMETPIEDICKVLAEGKLFGINSLAGWAEEIWQVKYIETDFKLLFTHTLGPAPI